jgi:hypothetical protein
VHPLAHAGTRLYPAEGDYSGLVALDPADPYTVYISTNVDPDTGDPLISRADGRQHWELFRGRTRDGGASWECTAITSDSREDNLRPIARAVDEQHTMVIWLRGAYRSYTDYDLEVLGLLLER